MATKNTILVKNHSDVREEFTATAAAITPGHLLVIDSAGLVKVHATADGPVFPLFAVEDELQGKKFSDAYAASAKIQTWIPGRGDIVFAILADNNTIVIGDFLTSNGDGTLKKMGVIASPNEESPSSIVGQAVEAVDTSNSAVATARILIRVM